MKANLYLLYKINNAIIERNLLQPNQHILIAVSGGQDSICLLRIFLELKKKWNWRLGIIHCDHKWSCNSKFQAEHVACLAVRSQLDYYQGITVGSVKKERVARIWRYDIIQTVAVSNKYHAIITGHNASDRVETLLYNLTRGSGLHGLQSIKWKRFFVSSLLNNSAVYNNKTGFVFQTLKYRKDFTFFYLFTKKKFSLARPFLETTRTEIRKVVNFWNFPLWVDKSNQEVGIGRNRTRNRLVPYLRKNYNLNIDKTLTRWSEIVQAETFYLEKITSFLLSKIQIIKKCYLVTKKTRKRTFTKTFNFYQSAISIDVLQSLPIAIQRRVLKQHVYKITGRSLGFQFIEQIRLSCLFHNFVQKNISKRSNNLHSFLAMEKKRNVNKSTISWIILPRGIKIFITQNYLFFISPLVSLFS